MCRHFAASAAITLEKYPPADDHTERDTSVTSADNKFVFNNRSQEEEEEEEVRHGYLNNMEQALQQVVSSKQCIWKSWLFAVQFSGHIFDLQP